MSQLEQLSKIRWRCRRGMLELDTLLGRFLNKHINTLNTTQLDKFEALLETPDQVLFDWIIGRAKTDDPELDVLVKMIA